MMSSITEIQTTMNKDSSVMILLMTKGKLGRPLNILTIYIYLGNSPCGLGTSSGALVQILEGICHMYLDQHEHLASALCNFDLSHPVFQICTLKAALQ